MSEDCVFRIFCFFIPFVSITRRNDLIKNKTAQLAALVGVGCCCFTILVRKFLRGAHNTIALKPQRTVIVLPTAFCVCAHSECIIGNEGENDRISVEYFDRNIRNKYRTV